MRAAVFSVLHADDAHSWLQEGHIDAARAWELGVADAQQMEDVLPISHWLTRQPQTGIRHMLQLTCSGLKAAVQVGIVEHAARVQSLATNARGQLQRRAIPSESGSTYLESADQPPTLRAAGIHALEVYVQRHCASAAELEVAHGLQGKVTSGLMVREWAACDEDENVVSMALTVARRLIERQGVRHKDVGMLQVKRIML